MASPLSDYCDALLGILQDIFGWFLSFEHFLPNCMSKFLAIRYIQDGFLMVFFSFLFFFCCPAQHYRTIWKSYGHFWIFCCPAFSILLRTSRNGLTNRSRMWQIRLPKSRYLTLIFVGTYTFSEGTCCTGCFLLVSLENVLGESYVLTSDSNGGRPRVQHSSRSSVSLFFKYWFLSFPARLCWLRRRIFSSLTASIKFCVLSCCVGLNTRYAPAYLSSSRPFVLDNESGDLG